MFSGEKMASMQKKPGDDNSQKKRYSSKWKIFEKYRSFEIASFDDLDSMRCLLVLRGLWLVHLRAGAPEVYRGYIRSGCYHELD